MKFLATLLLLWSVYMYQLQASAEAEAEGQAKGQPPNVLFILSDDLGYGELSVFGQRNFSTPNADRVARVS